MSKVVAIAVIALAALEGWSAAHAEPVLREVSRITLPSVHGRIDHLAADLLGKRLFVAALGNNSVEVVDVEGKKVIATLKGFNEPQGILVVPDGSRLLVTNAGTDYADVLDARSLTSIAHIPLHKDGDNIRYDASNGVAWIGAGEDNHGVLVAVNTATNKVVREIPLRGHPESFQLESHGSRLVVNVPTAKVVQVLDRDVGKPVAEWSVPAEANFPMALDEASNRLFVVTRAPARLVVYDMRTGKVVANVDAVGDSDDVFYDAKTGNVYVSGGQGYVYVYRQENPDRYSLIEKVATRRGARTSLFVPEWKQLFVAIPRQGEEPAEIGVFSVASPN